MGAAARVGALTAGSLVSQDPSLGFFGEESLRAERLTAATLRAAMRTGREHRGPPSPYLRREATYKAHRTSLRSPG
jgi:hypothetical protein